jgi:hypothetical protein
MAMTDKIKNFSSNVQQATKNTGRSVFQIILRLISGFFIGLILALICQEIFQLGTLMLVFLTTVFLGVVFKLLGPRTIFQIIIFDFICVLIASLLRMYVMIAPN